MPPLINVPVKRGSTGFAYADYQIIDTPGGGGRDMLFNGQEFITIGGGATYSSSCWSSDGISWSSGTQNSMNGLTGIATNGSIYVGLSSGKIYSSPTGKGASWTLRYTHTDTGGINAVAWNGSIFCAVGSSGRVFTSSNGTSWSYVGTPLGGATHYSIEAKGNTFYAGSAFCSVNKSTNGAVWTNVNNFGSVAIYGIAFGEADTCAVVGNDNLRVYSSDNFINEIKQTTSSVYQLKDVVWDGEYFIGVGKSTTNAVLVKTKNGVSWDLTILPINDTFNAGAVSSNRIVFTSNSRAIVISK